MLAEALTVRSKPVAQGVLLIDLAGMLNSTSQDPLMKACQQGWIQGGKIFLLNFHDVIYTNTAGIESLIFMQFYLKEQGGSLGAIGPDAQFLEIFRLTQLDEMIPVYQDLDQALTAIQKGDFVPHVQIPLPGRRKEEGHWARPLPFITLEGIPPEAMNLNTEGRQTTGPIRGFGPLWLKTYIIRLTRMDISPETVVRTWRDNFQSFWPTGTRIYPSGGSGISLGNPALLNLKMPGGLIVAAGIRVIYMDENSFSFMTVRGHILSAWITFGASKVQGTMIVYVRALLRTSDPIMEILLRLGGATQEDVFWHHTLKAIAGHFGIDGYVEQENRCIDHHFQWLEAKNIRYNGVILSSFHMSIFLWRKRSGN